MAPWPSRCCLLFKHRRKGQSQTQAKQCHLQGTIELQLQCFKCYKHCGSTHSHRSSLDGPGYLRLRSPSNPTEKTFRISMSWFKGMPSVLFAPGHLKSANSCTSSWHQAMKLFEQWHNNMHDLLLHSAMLTWAATNTELNRLRESSSSLAENPSCPTITVHSCSRSVKLVSVRAQVCNSTQECQ